MEEIKNSWCQIPHEVWVDQKLTLPEKCLLGRIIALAVSTGSCFSGNEYLATELGRSVSQVQTMLRKLEKLGYIKRFIVYKENTKQVEKRLITPVLHITSPHIIHNTTPHIMDNTYRIDVLDKNIDNNNGSSEELPPTSKNSNYKTEYGQKYIDAFNRFFNSNFRLTSARVSKLKLRFKTYTADEIAQALINLSESKFHQSDNDRGWKATPDFLIRSDEQIDIWLNKGGDNK